MSKQPDWGRFELATPDDSARCIIAASQGVAGSGKTHFWLTAPQPIAYFGFDPGGLKGLKSNPAFRGMDLRFIDYCGDLNIGKLQKDERMARAIEIMGQFQEDWDVAIRNARTLVWDKEAHVWEMLRYAHNEVDSPEPKSFHELNLMYRGWIQDAEANERNLGLIRGVHDTWGKTGNISRSGKEQMGFTGIFKPEGQKYVPELVQVNMEHRWDEDDREFKLKILEKCRLGNTKELMGQEFGGLDFGLLAVTLYPESAIMKIDRQSVHTFVVVDEGFHRKAQTTSSSYDADNVYLTIDPGDSAAKKHYLSIEVARDLARALVQAVRAAGTGLK